MVDAARGRRRRQVRRRRRADALDALARARGRRATRRARSRISSRPVPAYGAVHRAGSQLPRLAAPRADAARDRRARTPRASESDAALAYARVWGTPGYIGQALTVAGLIRGGEAGLELLREAVAELERSPAARELAVSLVELGAALRRRGRARGRARAAAARRSTSPTRAGSSPSPRARARSSRVTRRRACGAPRSPGWTR